MTLLSIHATYQVIFEEWLPTSGYQSNDGLDFEFYPEGFDPDDPEKDTLKIYFPIRKA